MLHCKYQCRAYVLHGACRLTVSTVHCFDRLNVLSKPVRVFARSCLTSSLSSELFSELPILKLSKIC